MLAQLFDELGELWRELRPRLFRLWVRVLRALRGLWSLVRPPLFAILQIIAALIVLFEEWGWRPLFELISRLARFRLWARLELWIAGLPPYGAFVVFALPTTILLPLKFVAVWLLAGGHVLTASALFIAAKVLSTALIARIFMLTKPALMQIAWFARAYNRFMPWKDALFARIRASWTWRYGRMLKTRVKLRVNQARARLEPKATALWQTWRPVLIETSASLRARLREAWDRLKPRIVSELQRARIEARSLWRRISGA